MLSSIHPLGEAGRAQRWWLTVTAHIVGSTLGGAVAAGALGALGTGVAGLGVGLRARLVLVAAVAAVAVVADARRWPVWLWRPRRQVNEDWLARYRGWVYGGGFGLQLGLGVGTIVTAATVYVSGAAAFAVAHVGAAAAIGAVFGGVRGASVLAARRVERSEHLVELHRRLQRRAPAGRAAATVADFGVLVGVVALLAVGA